MKLIRVLLLVIIGSSLGYIIFDYLNGGFDYQNVMYNHMYSNQSNTGYILNSVLIMIILFSVIILVLSFQKNPMNSSSNVVKILDVRLSKGEITIEEHKELMEVLK